MICIQCGVEFQPRTPAEKLHSDECRLKRKRVRERKGELSNSEKDYIEAEMALAKLRQTKPEPTRPVFRARSLASTPDIPALGRDRGEQMTGSAAAVCQHGTFNPGNA